MSVTARLTSVVLLIACAACTHPDLDVPVRAPEPPPATAFTPPEGFTKLTISTTPYLDPQTLQQSLTPLAQYLSGKLGVPVEIVRAENYGHLGELMKTGKVDLGSFSPLSYVRARNGEPALQPVVNFISDGAATSAGYIVVRADSPVNTLEELQGRSFAYVDPSSTSGYLYPRALLRSKNLDANALFSRTLFTGNHEASLQAVYDRKVDAAAIFQGALPALSRSRGIDPLSFRIIAKTMRTPKDIFCARARLPPEVVTQLRRALLAISARTEEGRRVLSPLNVNGFIPADDALYETVRQVDAQLAESK